jgi:hypothetical protein
MFLVNMAPFRVARKLLLLLFLLLLFLLLLLLFLLLYLFVNFNTERIVNSDSLLAGRPGFEFR